MPDWPLPLVYALLVVIVFLRAGATYALGYGVRGLTDRRVHLAERPSVQGAERVVGRYGPVVVTLSFLTVGIQTAVNAAAGTLRMPLRRYLPALFVGALIWGGIYVSVGLAVLEAFWSGRWWLVPLAAALFGGVVWLIRREFARRAGPGGP